MTTTNTGTGRVSILLPFDTDPDLQICMLINDAEDFQHDAACEEALFSFGVPFETFDALWTEHVNFDEDRIRRALASEWVEILQDDMRQDYGIDLGIDTERFEFEGKQRLRVEVDLEVLRALFAATKTYRTYRAGRDVAEWAPEEIAAHFEAIEPAWMVIDSCWYRLKEVADESAFVAMGASIDAFSRAIEAAAA